MARKRFNFRYFCFSALVVACAVLPCILGISLTVSIILGAVALICGIAILFFKLSFRTKATVLSLLLLFAILCPVNVYRLVDAPYLPEGDDMAIRFYVHGVSVDKAEISGKFVDLNTGMEYNGAIFTNNYLAFGHEFSAGSIVDMTANVHHIVLITDGKISQQYLNGYRYSLNNVNVYSIQHDGFPMDFSATIRAFMLERVNELFEGDARGVAAALLFGDKSMISSAVKDDMSASGLSHVLAISGLHFTVIAGIIAYLLSKTKAHIGLKTAISVIIMLLYAWICNFSPSVTRAFIMMAVASLGKLVCRKYDILSSICFAATISLVISPEELFSLSFLMSYTAVLGIVFAYAPLKRALHKLPKKVGDFVAVSLAANIGILPVVCNAFGKTSVLFLVSNALVLPLMTIAYVLLLTSLVPSLIGVGIGAVCNLLIGYVLKIGEVVSSLPFSQIDLPALGIVFTAAYYLILIYSSEYIFKKKVPSTPEKYLENTN